MTWAPLFTQQKGGSNSTKACRIFKPFIGQNPDLGRGAEASEKGRKLIRKHIYKPLDPANATDLMNNWERRKSLLEQLVLCRAYKHDKMYRSLWPKGTVLLAYPHHKIVDFTAKHRQNPLDAKAKPSIQCSNYEAPVSLEITSFQ